VPTCGSRPTKPGCAALLDPLLGAIEKLHSEGVYHRDIAPDNIQIEPDGHPVLLDFGAARRVISDKSQALTAILKPAYAPIEQYAEVGSVRQGPWTDLYALGATLHYLLLGRPPPPATARAVHDDMSALARQRLPGCSEQFLGTIDWMLAPRPADRPQSVAQLRAALDGQALPPAHAPSAPAAGMEDTLLLPPGAMDMDISLDGPMRRRWWCPPRAVPVAHAADPAGHDVLGVDAHGAACTRRTRAGNGLFAWIAATLGPPSGRLAFAQDQACSAFQPDAPGAGRGGAGGCWGGGGRVLASSGQRAC
jgi:hypothetical protein